MANPYTVTLEFPEETLSTGPTWQLIFRFTVNVDGTSRADQAADNGIVIPPGGRGQAEWLFDFDRLLVIPGEMQFKIFDNEGYLRNLLFSQSAEGVACEKNFECEILLDGSTEFLGNCIPRSVEYETEGLLSGSPIGMLSFSAVSNIAELTKTSVFNRNGLPTDPLNYTGGSAVNISDLSIAYNMNEDAELTITHAVLAGALGVGTIIKLIGISATERSVSYLNDSYEVIEQLTTTTTKVYAPASLEEDIGLTFSFGQLKVISVTAQVKPIQTLLEDIYGVIDSSVVVSLSHDWLFNTGWSVGVAVSNAVSSGGSTTITHTENTQILGQDLDLQVGDFVMFALLNGETMTDLSGEFEVTAVNSSTECEIDLDTAQSFSTGAIMRKITYDEIDDISIQIDDLFGQDDYTSGDNDLGIENLADILRALSIDFFAMTGALHNQKAFLKKITWYDANNLQVLPTVISRIEQLVLDRYSLIEHGISAKISLGTNVNKVFAFGDTTIFQDQVLQRQSFTVAFQSKKTTNVSDEFVPDSTSYTMFNETPSPDWAVVSIKDQELIDLGFDSSPYDNWRPNLWLVARLWLSLLGGSNERRIEKLVVDGCTIDFLKGFEYDSGRYNIIGLSKNFEDETTEITAIRIADA